MKSELVLAARGVTILPPIVPSVEKVSMVVRRFFDHGALVSVVIPAAIQPSWWEVVKSSFVGSQVQQVVMRLVIHQTQNVSASLLSRAFQYFRSGIADGTTTLAVVTSESETIQNRYGELMRRLTPLVMHFHDAMQGLGQADRSVALNLEEALRLQVLLESLTEEDLNAAVKNLSERLESIVAVHQENMPILMAVIDDLQAAEKDLAEAVMEMKKIKREFEVVVEELSILKFLIEQAGLEQDEELKTLLQKLERVQ